MFSPWISNFKSRHDDSASSSGTKVDARKVNDSLYELHKPSGAPRMQVLFFHGLQFEISSEMHFSTWESGDGSCWPQSWLIEEFPDAQVFCVSYNGIMRNNRSQGESMYVIGENLTSDLMQEDIGQVLNCPVILVGHSFGGLVIKQLCYHAHDKLHLDRGGIAKTKLETFLDNIRGIFYYATPHHGSPTVEKMADMRDNDLFTYFRILSSETARLNSNFDQLCRLHANWQTYALGEHVTTRLRSLGDQMLVPDASARSGHNFYVVPGADHFSITKPMSKTGASFQKLKEFLSGIASNIEAQDHNPPENFQYLPKSLVGIELPMKQITEKLVTVATVGIVGMGGSGKTTLARAIYNKLCQNFEYTCFAHKSVEGDRHNLSTCTYRHGKKVEIYPPWLGDKKVLIVMDDVSSFDLDTVSMYTARTSSESRFIVTSRDRRLLNTLDEVYMLPLLNGSDARQLFLSHAFPENQGPSRELQYLVEKIVSKCDGLPLTLEVMGKFLCKNANVQYSEQTLHALANADSVSNLDERLWAKLRISYDRLKDAEKQIFLDATTFFSGNQNWTLCDAKAAWRVTYDTEIESLLWQTLVDSALVYGVREDESIKVHEQFQSLGRKIASEPENCSKHRVWETKNAWGLLSRKKSVLGKEHKLDDGDVHSLRVKTQKDYVRPHMVKFGSGPSPRGRYSLSEGGPFQVKNSTLRIPKAALCRLKNVRYMDIDVSKIIIDGVGERESLPTKLVLLHCDSPKLTQVLLQPSLRDNMVGLKLHGCNLDGCRNQLLPASLCCFPALHRRAATHMERMLEEIQHFSQLEILELKYAPCLGFLPPTFGQLSKLRQLRLNDCVNLYTLPACFGELSALSYLKLSYCPVLSTLPPSFGLLKALSHLEFQQCRKLHSLPESFGQLSSLTHLEFSNCPALKSLPKSFGQLSSLTHLTFTFCVELDNLPQSFGQLKSLSHLELKYCCSFHSFPTSFGELSSLTHLGLVGCSTLDNLPNSFGQLKALRSLELSGCKELRALPESFVELSSLHQLIVSDSVFSLPKSFGDLSSLKHLEFRFQTFDSLPESFGQLRALRYLKFMSCDNLHSLPKSFGELSSLTHLDFRNCCKLDNLPHSFGELSSLRHLDFIGCDELAKLPESCGKLNALRHLKFESCINLRTLPKSLGELASLTELQVYFCAELDNLPKSGGQLEISVRGGKHHFEPTFLYGTGVRGPART